MKRAREGFTLVELLVVVVIIGMLVGLLVPAVISARERARQGVCTSRLKELGTAALHYASIKGQLPGWRNNAPLVNSSSGNTEALSWAVTLFPYMGREDLWQDWRAGATGAAPVLFAELTCPSDSANSGPCALNYVANTGLEGEDVDGQKWNVTTRPNLRDARWGVFHDRYNQSNPVGITLEYLSQNDGAATTLLFSERLSGATTGTWNYVANDGYGGIGFVWQGEDWQGVDLTNARVSDHISSNHSGGTTACFADGHVQQLSDLMSYNTYQALVTPNGLKYREDNNGVFVERGISSKDY